MPNVYQYADYIDRDSPIPLYQQVSADMMRRIVEGEWQIGDSLISEITLADLYHVSRITMRQALAQLEKDGLISRKRGGRSVIEAQPQYIMQDLQLPKDASKALIVNPTEEIRASNIRIINLEVPNRRAAQRLRLPEDAPLVHLERYLENDGKVLGINQAWFPRDRFPDLAERGLLRKSISGTLREVYHVEAESVENFIAGITLDAHYAKILGVPYASPALRIDSVHFCDQRIPFEFSSTTWNAANMQFHLLVSK